MYNNKKMNDIKNENGYNIINNDQNYIVTEIYIEEKDINKKLRILNSFEEYKRNNKVWWMEKEDYNKYENEQEIKENIEIYINENKIEFSYYYTFNNKGKYNIKYKFKTLLTKTCFMFIGCDSLINIDLSNFNTQNVINMSCMLSECKSLININLSNFNTQNVIDMSEMFCKCESLINIDISSFDTQKVVDISGLFGDCYSLKNIDLSNFNTQNIKDMRSMFIGCKSLSKVNLSNFTTQNDTDMSFMFVDCPLLKKENIITKNKKILDSFEPSYQ